MTRTSVLLTAVAAIATAAYTYEHVQDFGQTLSNWQANGADGFHAPLWTTTAFTGGSLISQHPALTGVNTYEIKANLTLTTSGGNYVFYLAAPNNALMGQTSANGNFYALEIANPTFTGAACQATLNFRALVNGALTAPLYSGLVSCRNGMEVRVILSTAQAIYAFVDGVYVFWGSLGAQPAGRAGIGGFNMPPATASPTPPSASSTPPPRPRSSRPRSPTAPCPTRSTSSGRAPPTPASEPGAMASSATASPSASSRPPPSPTPPSPPRPLTPTPSTRSTITSTALLPST